MFLRQQWFRYDWVVEEVESVVVWWRDVRIWVEKIETVGGHG